MMFIYYYPFYGFATIIMVNKDFALNHWNKRIQHVSLTFWHMTYLM